MSDPETLFRLKQKNVSYLYVNNRNNISLMLHLSSLVTSVNQGQRS